MIQSGTSTTLAYSLMSSTAILATAFCLRLFTFISSSACMMLSHSFISSSRLLDGVCSSFNFVTLFISIVLSWFQKSGRGDFPGHPRPPAHAFAATRGSSISIQPTYRRNCKRRQGDHIDHHERRPWPFFAAVLARIGSGQERRPHAIQLDGAVLFTVIHRALSLLCA